MIDGVMTTGQAAKALCLSVRKVSEMIDRGDLRGWRIPGSSHRRVLADEVNALAATLGLPRCGDNDQQDKGE